MPTPILEPLVVYGAPLAAALLAYALVGRRRNAANRTILDDSVAAGLTEPASLHPVIDQTSCIGCGSCVAACPEKTVLGMIDRRAHLINPTSCIGHGACKSACPMDAITLVFGTETRGVDLPFVSPTYETNVSGLFIAGELGGMGLIRNAIEQGRQAIDGIRTRLAAQAAPASPDAYDLVIVGAGPAGLSASLAAIEHGLKFVTLEQDTVGGTVAHYPRGKIVMTRPAVLPLVGKMTFLETSKEALVEYLDEVLDKTGLQVRCNEQVVAVDQLNPGFRVTTSRDRYETRAVLLAIGRRGTPRKLNVPGEDRPKVVYRLIDPQQYGGRRVLVVGGGDSAIEAATSLARVAGTEVTLSYRGDAFGRARAKNRAQLNQEVKAGRIDLRLGSEVVGIGPDEVEIRLGDKTRSVPNDAVIVCAGGVLPTEFLRSVGISIETKYGTA